MNIDERLDLDSEIKKLIEAMPDDDENCALFMRGNKTQGDCFMCSSGDTELFVSLLVTTCKQVPEFKEALLLTVESLKE